MCATHVVKLHDDERTAEFVDLDLSYLDVEWATTIRNVIALEYQARTGPEERDRVVSGVVKIRQNAVEFGGDGLLQIFKQGMNSPVDGCAEPVA